MRPRTKRALTHKQTYEFKKLTTAARGWDRLYERVRDVSRWGQGDDLEETLGVAERGGVEAHRLLMEFEARMEEQHG